MKEPWDSDSKRRDPWEVHADGSRVESEPAARRTTGFSKGFEEACAKGSFHVIDPGAMDEEQMRAEAARMFEDHFGDLPEDADVKLEKLPDGGWRMSAKSTKSHRISFGSPREAKDAKSVKVDIPLLTSLLLAMALALYRIFLAS